MLCTGAAWRGEERSAGGAYSARGGRYWVIPPVTNIFLSSINNATRYIGVLFFWSSRRRHTRFDCDWSSDVCSSDLVHHGAASDQHRLASRDCESGHRPCDDGGVADGQRARHESTEGVVRRREGSLCAVDRVPAARTWLDGRSRAIRRAGHHRGPIAVDESSDRGRQGRVGSAKQPPHVFGGDRKWSRRKRDAARNVDDRVV